MHGDNIVIVKAGQILTPPLSAGALYGITRGVVIETGARGWFDGRRAELDTLRCLQRGGVLLDRHGRGTDSDREDRRARHRRGQAGPITRRLVDKYRALTKVSGEPIYG